MTVLTAAPIATAQNRSTVFPDDANMHAHLIHDSLGSDGIQSAVFPQNTLVTNTQTDGPTKRRRNSTDANRPLTLYVCDAAY